jgi:hypothetical protein
MSQATIPDSQGLAEELSAIIADLTSLEAIVYEAPERLSTQDQQEVRQELANLKQRLARIIQ